MTMDMGSIIDKMKEVMGGDEDESHGDKPAEKLMEKESKEPQHNEGNESISDWAKQEEAEPEHAKSTQDKSLMEWAQEEDAEPDLSIGPDGQLYICDKPLGDPEVICEKIQELMKSGAKANASAPEGSGVKVTLIKAIPEQGGSEDADKSSDASSAS